MHGPNTPSWISICGGQIGRFVRSGDKRQSCPPAVTVQEALRVFTCSGLERALMSSSHVLDRSTNRLSRASAPVKLP